MQKDSADGGKNGKEKIEQNLPGGHQNAIVGHVGQNHKEGIDCGNHREINRGMGDDLLDRGFDIHCLC